MSELKLESQRNTRGAGSMLATSMYASFLMLLATSASAQQAPPQHKPNIVIIWGDDIGQSNISAYTHGLMGYQTPNIDRVAKEGMMFTDYYAEQSCTAVGRSSPANSARITLAMDHDDRTE